MKTTMNTEQMWDLLLENDIATEDELQLVTSINGYNEEALTDILYVRTGYKDFDEFWV